jgi:aspartate-semialdehyde dehydrogenase
LVVDNSSAFRLADDVPLVVPEVNAHALRHHRGLVANPNCSAIIMLLALAPLHRAARLTRVIVSTYQSVSGAGAKAVAQLYEETRRALARLRVSRSQLRIDPTLTGRALQPRSALPAQIAFNVIPQVEAFQPNRYTKEEMKMVYETRKILEAPHLAVSATCVRVPVLVGHSEAVWIETARPLSVQRALGLLRRAPGVRVVDDPAAGRYPLPIDAAGQDAVLVGRVRKDESARHGLAFWVSGDNLRKGAATNAIQIAELLIKGRTP